MFNELDNWEGPLFSLKCNFTCPFGLAGDQFFSAWKYRTISSTIVSSICFSIYTYCRLFL